jgi:hypothetical protein
LTSARSRPAATGCWRCTTSTSRTANPDLRACIAGVFLAARRADGSWEEPERFPIECRTLAVLGEVEGEAGAGGAAWCWIEP